MPTNRITSAVCPPSGKTWEATAYSPTADSTEVAPSSTGMPAASNAPKATSMISRVTGRLIVSAVAKLLPRVVSTSSSMRSPPVACIRMPATPGAVAASATAARKASPAKCIVHGGRYQHRPAVRRADRVGYRLHPGHSDERAVEGCDCGRRGRRVERTAVRRGEEYLGVIGSGEPRRIDQSGRPWSPRRGWPALRWP